MTTNTYSQIWFDTFLAPYPPEQTEAEVAFIARHLPLQYYPTVLDLCCGSGRHALPLAARGYKVTGLDLNPQALAEARRRALPGATFLTGDIRDLSLLPGTFDAVTNLWQSFGYFDAETNADILRQIYGKLNPDGRLVLDIYYRDFFERHEGERTFSRNGIEITESKRLDGDRLVVTLHYGLAVPPDVFQWHLYTPEAIEALAGEIGFQLLVSCTGFDETKPPVPTSPRMQLLFEKSSL